MNQFLITIFLSILITACGRPIKVHKAATSSNGTNLSPIFSFTISDPQTKSETHTNSPVLNVQITEQNVSAWCLTESTLDATEIDCPNDNWQTSRPTSFSLSNGDGAKSIFLWVKDTKGSLAKPSTSQSITLDTTIPEITLAPTSNVNLSNLLSYSLSGTCESDLNVIIQIAGIPNLVPCLGGVWLNSFNLSSYGDGNIALQVNQVDLALNSSLPIMATISKDAIAPIITLSTPTQSSYINLSNQSTVNFSGTCSDDGAIQVSGALSKSINCTSGLFSENLDFTSIPEGAQSLSFNTSDGFNNQSSTINLIIIKDTQAPVMQFVSPEANAYINDANKAAFGISGTCTEDGKNVTISGAASATALCESNFFIASLDFSAQADGTVTISISQTDAAGNASNSTSRSFIKDVLPPTLTQTAISNNQYSNLNQVQFSGACENGATIAVMGTDTSLATCSLASWNYQTNAQTSDATYAYQFIATDTAGNSISINGSWIRDSVVPTLSFFEIADGATNIGTFSTFVKVEGSDDKSIAWVRFSDANFVTGSCQSEYANNGWQSYAGGRISYSYIIPSGDGDKKVCAWVKDAAGNVSTISPDSGSSGVNTDTVTYEVGNIPQVLSFSAKNNSAGTNFGTQKFSLNDQVLIEWTATDAEGLGDNPIKLEYTINNSTWTTITSAYGGTTPSSPYVGSYTFNAPTASYFRIRILVKDKANNSSMEYRSQPLNTGQWTVYAGTNAIGLGGSYNAVQLSKGAYDNAYGDAAVNPKNGDVYFYSYGKGLYRSNAITGIVEKYIGNSGTNIGSKTFVDASTNISVVPTMKFDTDGNLYIKVINRIYKINPQTNAVKFLFGGGSTTSPPYTATNLFVSDRTDFDLDLGKNIYFFVDCAVTVPWTLTYNNTVKLAKATYDSASDSYSFSDYAGNCTLADPANGADALTNPLGKIMYQHLLSLTVNGDGSLIYYGQNTIRKIYNGVIYSTNVTSNMGISLYKFTNTLYGASGKLNKYTNTAVASGNSETTSTVISSTGGVNCNDDGTIISSACVNIFHGNGKGNVFTGFNNEVYFVDLGARVRLINPKNQKIYTLMGTKPIHGIGQDKLMLRAQLPGGIYFKKASESNQSLFPTGLYFTDEYSMTFNYVNPTTGIVTTIAGNQSLVPITTDGDNFNTSLSLGNSHSNHNLASLTFDEYGLPWFVTDTLLRKVEADGKMYKKQNGSTRWSQAIQGSNPRNFISIYFFGLNNLSVFNSGVFALGQAYATPSETALNATVMQFHDYANSIVQHMMGGGATTNVGFSADNNTPGAQKNMPLSSTCMASASCFNQYDSSYDLFYFSENNNLRYLTNPKTPLNSTLHTLFDAGRIIRNFIFSEDKEQVYYVSSDGKLYCYDLMGGTAPAHCTNTDLGPVSGLSIITSRPNQLTWKSSNELLINTRSGEIYQYTIP